MEIALLALGFAAAAAVVILIAKKIASHPFRCGHCSREFRVKWPRILITEHSDRAYRLVCPFCKVKDWCTEQSEKL